MNLPPLLLLRRPRRIGISLKTRLAVLVMSLLLVLSASLVIFINVAASVTVPTSETEAVQIIIAPPESWQSAYPTPTPATYGTPPGTEGPLSTAATTTIRQAVLAQLQSVSLLGLALVAIIGSIGACWIAGRALRPLSDVSTAMRRVSTGNLDTRPVIATPDEEIRELTEAFATMLDRLHRAFDQQSQFVSNAAHELRTPLATLRTNIELTYTDPDATLEDYRQAAPVLERTLTRLEHLVTDLLAMATEESALVSGEVALKPLAEEVITELKPMAEEHNISLHVVGDDVKVRGHGLLLARAFSNLVENGIRYDAPGGDVEIGVYSRGGSAVVTVADTGSGIPIEHQDKVFDRFYRVSRVRSVHKGSAGLGLSIVAHIADLHGGRVEVESVPGSGSKFTLQLPL